MPTSKISTLFFDLDHTLWDYEVNSRETLSDLFSAHALSALLGCDLGEFLDAFRVTNNKLWSQYNGHKIDRATIRTRRFADIFSLFGVENQSLSLAISDEYIRVCPTKSHLFPHAIETLDYLYNRYPMHIITNGFDDVQETKMNASDLSRYFNVVITSETAGLRKPSPEIFTLACDRAGAAHKYSLMIGDNLQADIEGAMAADLQAAYFNPHHIPHDATPHFEISSLKQLQDLL